MALGSKSLTPQRVGRRCRLLVVSRTDVCYPSTTSGFQLCRCGEVARKVEVLLQRIRVHTPVARHTSSRSVIEHLAIL